MSVSDSSVYINFIAELFSSALSVLIQKFELSSSMHLYEIHIYLSDFRLEYEQYIYTLKCIKGTPLDMFCPMMRKDQN